MDWKNSCFCKLFKSFAYLLLVFLYLFYSSMTNKLNISSHQENAN